MAGELTSRLLWSDAQKKEQAAKDAAKAAEEAKANQPPQMPDSYAQATVPLPVVAPQAQPDQAPSPTVQPPEMVPLRSVSTTTQSGVPNMPGYESSLRSAFDAQGAASRLIADEQANQAKQKATLLQQAAKQARDEEKAYSEQRKALEADRLADEQALKSLEDQKKSIDPNRVFKNQNLGQKFMGFLGLAMGGFLEGFTHGQIKNPALAIINRFVDLDVEAQREDIRQHERALAGKERRIERKGAALRELDSTSALRQAKIWEMASRAIEADLSTREPGIIRAQNEQALSVARQKQAQLENEAFQATKARSSTTSTKQDAQVKAGGVGSENVQTQTVQAINSILNSTDEFASLMEKQQKAGIVEMFGAAGASAIQKATGYRPQGLPGATFDPQRGIVVEHMASADRGGGVPTDTAMQKREAAMPGLFTDNETARQMALHEFHAAEEKLKNILRASPTPEVARRVEEGLKHIANRRAGVLSAGKK